MAHLIAGLFSQHDHHVFNLYCYSTGLNDGSAYRKKIERECDRFVDLRGMSHYDSASRINKDRVDILVDLNGNVKGENLPICAFRPAPLQVSYLGFPGTTGSDLFQYIIADKIVAPEEHAPFYSEKIVYMPHCYQVNDNQQAISMDQWEKRDIHIPQDCFVFCCFNGSWKIDPVMYDCWMNILKKVPHSILWLLEDVKTATKNLRKEAGARDVDPDRILFANRLPKQKHLARLRIADLALDTRIYNGHTTSSDVLWTGVPVVALQGSHFASCVSSSILTAIGLPELITGSLKEYEALAVDLASDPDWINGLKQKLDKHRLSMPLFDTPRFVNNLEKAYREMWRAFVSSETPRSITIKEN